MAQMIGSDVEALRRLAMQFDQSAQRLRALTGQVSNGVQVSAWVGPVSVRFRTSWDSEHSGKLKAAAAVLESNAQILRQNAADQEATSASLEGGAGSGSLAGGASGGGLSSLSPERVRQLEESIRAWAVEHPGLALEVVKLLKDGDYLKAGKLLPSIGDLGPMLNGLELAGPVSGLAGSLKTPGGILGLLAAGFSAKDLGEALGVGDEPGAWRAGVDLTAYVVTAGVPGGGIAWWLGSEIGDRGYKAADQIFHVTDANFASGVRSQFGPGVDPNNLTPEQAAAMTQRYEGPTGIAYSITDGVMAPIYFTGDAVGNAVYDAGTAVGDAIYDTGTTVGNAVYDAGTAVGDAVNDTSQAVGNAIDAVKKVKWPWQ